MRTIFYAKCLISIAGISAVQTVEIPQRGIEIVTELREIFGDFLVEIVFFEIKIVEIDGVTFSSEPINIENILIAVPIEKESKLKKEQAESGENMFEVAFQEAKKRHRKLN